MTERLGRFQRITAEEAQQRLTSARPAQALSEQFATLFATMEPLAYYELVLSERKRGHHPGAPHALRRGKRP